MAEVLGSLGERGSDGPGTVDVPRAATAPWVPGALRDVPEPESARAEQWRRRGEAAPVG